MNYHKNAPKDIQENENFLRNIENLKTEIAKERFDFSFCSFAKMKIKAIFGCSLTLEEKNILSADTIYKKESDVISLIERLQDVEKMKCVLLTKKQRKLLDLLKPQLRDLDEENLKLKEKSIKRGPFSEVNKNNENREEEIKEILKSYQEQVKIDVSKISEIDRTIIEYLNER